MLPNCRHGTWELKTPVWKHILGPSPRKRIAAKSQIRPNSCNLAEVSTVLVAISTECDDPEWFSYLKDLRKRF